VATLITNPSLGSSVALPPEFHKRTIGPREGLVVSDDASDVTSALVGLGLTVEVIGAEGGDVAGPASSTDNALARFNGLTGKVLEDSSAKLTDAGELSLASTGTTSSGLLVTANSLTTGRALLLQSSSAAADVRNLAEIVNTGSAVGATLLRLEQNGAGVEALSVAGRIAVAALDTAATVASVSGNSLTTGDALVVTGNALTTGSLARFTSDSAGLGSRNLVEISHTQTAEEFVTCLDVNNSGVGKVASLAGATATGDLVEILGGSLTTGRALYVFSDSADVSARSLVEIDNQHASSTSADCLLLQQASGRALVINQVGDSAAIIVAQSGVQASNILHVDESQLTTGSMLYLRSDSANVATRSLAQIINDNAAANLADCLTIQQDAAAFGLHVVQNANANAIAVLGAAVTTEYAAKLTSTTVTTGGLLDISSDSNEGSARALARITQSGASAAQVNALEISHQGEYSKGRLLQRSSVFCSFCTCWESAKPH